MGGRKRKAGPPEHTSNVSHDGNISQSEPQSTLLLHSDRKKHKMSTTRSAAEHTPRKTLSECANPSIPISQVDHDITLALLKTMDWTMAQNTSRRNVIRSDDPSTPRNSRNKPYCMSFIFGRNMKDPAGGLSWWSTKYPDVYDKLRALLEKYDPSFSYTHITLNRNLRCKRHTDGGNAGPSYIAAFGNFKGGKLLVEPPGGGRPEMELDLKSRFVKFNGKTQPHETLAFSGERFTLVYYTSDIEPEEGAVDRRRGGPTKASAVSSTLAAKFQAVKAKLGRTKK
ncbi:acetylcholine-gated cation-selective channel [Fragilaria crotonensis]|nr:acetylcholine-gated cation-selective channel [Fragilaria crotonensis]